MFLEKLRDFRHTLALRLTIWYAAIFAMSSTLAFVFVYVLMVSVVQERTDEDLEDDLEEFIALMQVGGLERVKNEMMLETQGEEAEASYFRLWAFDGRELQSTDLSSWPGLEVPREILKELGDVDEPILRTYTLPKRKHDVRGIYGPLTAHVILELGQSLEEDEEFIGTFLKGFLITLVTVIVFGGPIGWFLARRALVGIEEVTRTATEIADGALDRRVTVRSQDYELDRLAQTFNVMLDRIQALIVGMREMTDNLAHDLKSPLGRIRASAEIALAGDELKEGWEALAFNTIEECDRLLEMINVTLDIAEAESGAAKLRIATIDLVDIVNDACELFETIAQDRQITIVNSLPERCLIEGDRQWLQRIIANLLDNALKYTEGCGQVKITLVAAGEQIRLSIGDTGIGIPVDELPHIFQRFFRSDQSRSQQGNGLGLSLALAFVRAHGGDITVSSVLGQGSTFVVVLARSRRGRGSRRLAVEQREGHECEDLEPSGSAAS